MTAENFSLAMKVEGIGPTAKLALLWIVETSGMSGKVDLKDPSSLCRFLGASNEATLEALDELKREGLILPRDDRGRWMLTPVIFEIGEETGR